MLSGPVCRLRFPVANMLFCSQLKELATDGTSGRQSGICIAKSIHYRVLAVLPLDIGPAARAGSPDRAALLRKWPAHQLGSRLKRSSSN